MHRHAWAALLAALAAQAATHARGTRRSACRTARATTGCSWLTERRAGRRAGDPLQTYAVDWAKVESAPTARSIEPQSAVTCGCDLTHQGCVGRRTPNRFVGAVDC